MANYSRGLDASLAKTMSNLRGLTKETYRATRKNIQLFAKACAPRGYNATAEGALALFQCLESRAWATCEEMDLDLLDQPRRSTAFC